MARRPARCVVCPRPRSRPPSSTSCAACCGRPEIIVATWRAARSEIEGLSEDAVREALERLDPIWDELFPAEQARIVQLLVARVDVGIDGLDIHLRTQGLARAYRELAPENELHVIAA